VNAGGKHRWPNNPQRPPFPRVFPLAARFGPDTLSQDIPGFPKSLGCRLTSKLEPRPWSTPDGVLFVSGLFRSGE
jgi:hypothetical protein